MKPLIVGLSGPELTEDERDFIKKDKPAGFILFARNIESPEQVRRLTDSLREAAEWDHLPILIDQEGGRVQRLAPPHWPQYPAMAVFGDFFKKDKAAAKEALDAVISLMAMDLAELGITVDCLPVLDIVCPETHDVIGDRAFSSDPDIVAELGGVAVSALLKAGVLPVIKHIPGHGRASVDSHKELPVVDAGRDELSADWIPFRALRKAPFAMTAHVTYKALDSENCATQSPKIIHDIIRKEIGFRGLLMTDDLSMQALAGSVVEGAGKALSAGCDLLLHCNGSLAEMKDIAASLEYDSSLAQRFEEVMAITSPKPDLTQQEARAKLAAVTTEYPEYAWEI